MAAGSFSSRAVSSGKDASSREMGRTALTGSTGVSGEAFFRAVQTGCRACWAARELRIFSDSRDW